MRFYIFIIWIITIALAYSFTTVRTFLVIAPEFQNPLYLIRTFYESVRIFWPIVTLATIPVLWGLFFLNFWPRFFVLSVLNVWILREALTHQIESPLEYLGAATSLLVLLIGSYWIASLMKGLGSDAPLAL